MMMMLMLVSKTFEVPLIVGVVVDVALLNLLLPLPYYDRTIRGHRPGRRRRPVVVVVLVSRRRRRLYCRTNVDLYFLYYPTAAVH